MNTRDDSRTDWRETLVPPAGGLLRLIGAIERPRARFRGAGFTLGAVALAAVAAFGLGLWLRAGSFEERARAAFALSLAPAPAIRVDNGTAVEVASGDPEVRVYWIAQMPAPDGMAPDGG